METPFIPAQVDALLSGGERELQVPHPERSGRAPGEAPDQGVGVPQQARRLDPAVEDLAGLGELAALAPCPAEDLDQDEEVLALAGGTCHGQRPSAVRVGVGVAIQVEL